MLVLYKDDTTSFSNLGLGVLKDLRSDALITEELNGPLILEFEYTKKGHLSDSLVEGNLIKCNNQIFRIKNINKSLSDSESIKILAQQYFQFDMSKNFLADVAPTKLNGTNALKWIVDKAETKTNFAIGGDCTNVSSARYVRKNVSDAIYSADNSLLTRFGGELEFNLNNVYLKNKRGSDKGFSIRYRKNLKGLEFNLDFSTVATKICPQGSNELLLDDLYVSSPKINNYYQPFFKKVEFNDIGVDEETTAEQAKTLLKNAALELFDAGIDVPEISIKVDFVELSKCIEYKEYQNLETCSLGDTIKVIIPEFSINTSVRVVKTIYNDNLGRLTYLELGTVAKNIVSSNASSIKDIKNTIENPKSILDSAKKNATELINHPFKGNLYIDDKTGVLYLMDTNDISTAKNVWKWSMGGLGFSSNGINGTFNTAITQDGGIVADFITTGKINTDLIEGYSNLELAVQNSLLSITPQYCIEGKDEWSDTIPTTETWQKILTRNRYVATNGKITYSKVIPYVEGMNNLINSIEGTDVSIYNSNDEKMGLESIVLEGRCMQETRSGKNLFYTNVNTTTKNITMISDGSSFTLNGSTNSPGVIINYVSLGTYKAGTYTISFDVDIASIIRPTGDAAFYIRRSSDNYSYASTTITQLQKSGGKVNATFTIEEDTILVLQGYANASDITFNNTLFKIQIEKGSVATDYEPYGVMPSPDYPSEVECVKGKNLFDGAMESGGINTTTGNNLADSSVLRSKNYVSVKPNTTYIISNNSVGVAMNLFEYASDKSFISFAGVITAGKPFTTSSTTHYIRFYRSNSNVDKIQVEKGTVATRYIPYGNIQIVETGKNLFDKNSPNIIVNKYLNANGEMINDGSLSISDYIEISPNAVYAFQPFQSLSAKVCFYDKDKNFISSVGLYSINPTLTISENCVYMRSSFSKKNIDAFQIEKGPIATDYEPYTEEVVNIDLQGNELCSIGDVKDELVIKNGSAKIIKKTKKIVLTGSESVWYAVSEGFYTPTSSWGNKSRSETLSNYFQTFTAYSSFKDASNGAGFLYPNVNNYYLKIDGITTVAELKTWLSIHNTSVYYQLAEEQEIDLGEVDIINLFTEDNNILNSESANMKIGYYTDYTFYKTVMEQYAKIDLNNDNINIELAKKTNSKNIIATINMSTEKDDEGSLIQINSDKLNIKNKVFNLQSDEIEIESPNFSVSKEGKINAKSGLIGGFSLDDISFHTHIEDPYTYTIADATRVLEIANGSTATEEEMKKYDVNEDGVIDRLDYTIILRKIYGYEATSGDFYILANNPRYMIKTSSNGSKVKPTKIGLSMISTTNFYGCSGSFTSFDDNTSQTVIDGGQINCVALTQTSLEQHKKNIEKLSNAIEEIKKTDIYQYNWKSESNDKKKHLGFVIGKNFNYSHLITAENEKGKEIGVDNYSMISLCLQAIKEQQVIIEKLEIKINTLMKGIK